MTYNTTNWKSREVEHQNRFTMKDNGDGTVTLTPAPGKVIEIGTPASADNFNKMEKGILAAHIVTGMIKEGNSINIGLNSQATGSGIGIGKHSNGGDFGTAIGAFSETIGQATISLGSYSKSKERGIAVGNFAEALFSNSIAIGNSVKTTEDDEVLIGRKNNNVRIAGSLKVEGTKNFCIDHPTQEGRKLYHSTVETNTAGDNLYRYQVESDKENDVVVIELPDYFDALNKDIQIFVAPQEHFGQGYGTYEDNKASIHCQLKGQYNVLVIGTRQDKGALNWKEVE